jgi:hypothetical protein
VNVDTEYSFYMANGKFTFKCGACVQKLLSVMDENTPHHSVRTASTSEIGRKIQPPDKGLILPALKDSDSFSVQLETV